MGTYLPSCSPSPSNATIAKQEHHLFVTALEGTIMATIITAHMTMYQQ